MKTLEYFKIPHPLKRGEDIVVIEPESYWANLKDCYRICKGKKNVPIFRLLIKAAGKTEEEDIEQVRRAEKEFMEAEKSGINWAKLKLWLSLAFSLFIGYILYLSFSGLGFQFITYPVNWIFETFFNRGVDKWVVWVAIAFFPLVTACRIFLPLKIPGLGRFGQFGALYVLKKEEEAVRGFKFLGTNQRSRIRLSIKKYILALKKQSGLEPMAGEIKLVLEKILNVSDEKDLALWSEDFNKLLRELHLLSENHPSLWVEAEKFLRFREELVTSAITNFEVGRLRVVPPTMAQKAKNLESFLENTKSLREKIYCDYEKLQGEKDGEAKKALLKSLISHLELVAAMSSSYHFGDNPAIPQERGRILADFYQKTYRGLAYKLQNGKEKKGTPFYKNKRFLLWAADTPLRGLAFSLAVVFLAASLFSFYSLGPNQIGAQRELSFGMKNPQTRDYQFLSERLEFKEYGQGFRVFGRDIFWNLPAPLVKSTVVDFTREQNTEVYKIVLTRQAPVNLWDRINRFAQGSFGGVGYEGLKVTITFVPKTKEWASYDFDGKGSLRLSRDLASVLDSWQAKETESLYPEEGKEQEYVYTDYLEKLARSGEIGQYLRSFAQEQYNQQFYYTTNLETVSAIYNLFVLKIDAEIEDIKESGAPPDAEKKIQELEALASRLKLIHEDYRKEFAKEKSAIVTNPEVMGKLIDSFKDRSNLYLIWKDYPTLASLVYNYVYYTYANEEFFSIASQEETMGRLKDYLDGQKISQIIKIKEIKAERFFMTQFEYYMRVQTPIELLNK